MTSQDPPVRTTRSGKAYVSKAIREESEDDDGEDADMLANDAEDDMAFENEFKKSAKKMRKLNDGSS